MMIVVWMGSVKNHKEVQCHLIPFSTLLRRVYDDHVVLVLETDTNVLTTVIKVCQNYQQLNSVNPRFRTYSNIIGGCLE